MIKKLPVVALLGILLSQAVLADVALIEKKAAQSKISEQEKKDHKYRHGSAPGPNGPDKATGSVTLIDSGTLKYFINTDITFSTSSSASGAASEASYTGAVAATTSAGGTTSSTLNDAFDGYGTVCVSVDNTVAQCETGNANFIIYNQNGPSTTECNGRQVVLPVKTMGAAGLTLQRKVFVPTNDQFMRWMNLATNTGGAPITVTLVTANNLGSDNNTSIVTSSSGDAAAQTADTWLTSFQNYSGNTSSDVRLGHVFQGSGTHTVAMAGINFVDGDDNPFWGYTFTLQPGETKNIVTFVTGQRSKALAASKAAELAGFPDNARQCMSPAETSTAANFSRPLAIAEMPTLHPAGLALLGAALAGAAFWLLRRRRSA